MKPDNHRLPSMQTSWLTYRHHPLQMHATTYPRRLCLRGDLPNASSDCSAPRPGRGHRTVGLNILSLLLRDGGLFDHGLSHISLCYRHRRRLETILNCSSDMRPGFFRIAALHQVAGRPPTGTSASAWLGAYGSYRSPHLVNGDWQNRAPWPKRIHNQDTVT